MRDTEEVHSVGDVESFVLFGSRPELEPGRTGPQNKLDTKRRNAEFSALSIARKVLI